MIISGAGTAILAAGTSLLAHFSARKLERQVSSNLERLLGENALIQQFKRANNTIAAVNNSIEHRTITEDDIAEIATKIQSAEQVYKKVVARLQQNVRQGQAVAVETNVIRGDANPDNP
jgi:uncharacterized membrane protein YhiD involved in acid resistance